MVGDHVVNDVAGALAAGLAAAVWVERRAGELPEGAHLARELAEVPACSAFTAPTYPTASIRRRMPTSVVTGGTGFLGSHLCEYLLGQGHRVIAVDNLVVSTLTNIEQIRTDDFVFVNHDMTEHLVVDEPVDFVFHLAALASPIDYMRMPLHSLKVGSLRARTTRSAWPSSSARASCSPPRARCTATRWCIRSPSRTGATSTRSARAASTTRPSATPRR